MPDLDERKNQVRQDSAAVAQESAAFEEEAKREARANKERQRLYNRKYLAKKKIRKK